MGHRDELSLDVWGFLDSRFEVNADGDVTFIGDRYPISGKVLPELLPWARETIDAPLEPFDVHESSYPPELPERVQYEAFETAAVEIVGSQHISFEARDRLRHGHGHSQEDMWAIHHGSLPRVPDVVIRPGDVDEVTQLVEAAVKHGVCVIPYGGGTNVTEALRCSPE